MNRHGVLGELSLPMGLGLLRLSTAERPSREQALTVIHAAFDLGVRLLDTADSYGLDQDDLHYGERLAREALESWSGPRDEVRILTKVGLTRPKGRWVPNSRPEHLRAAVDRSLAALGVERLFLLQLHARDSRSSFEVALQTLAELQRAGKVLHLGLCNVTIDEVRQAQRHFPVAVVQNELSVLSRQSAEDGLLAFTREQGIPLLAHRPLGGYAKTARLGKNPVLRALAERHGRTPHELALAALLAASPHVVPLIGATRVESVRSSVSVLGISLDLSDRMALDMKFPFAASQDALDHESAVTVPQQPTNDEVVLIMGIQGAGKSELVERFVSAGYARLNRDQLGGRLDDLVPRLAGLIASGQRRVVLDNTYPTRTSRAPVILLARRNGLPVRCVHVDTPLPEAQINLVLRQLSRYGGLLGPDELKRLAKTDPNLPPPAALARWLSTFEPPALDEGFTTLETIPFIRRPSPSHRHRGLLLDVDGTLRRTVSGELYPRSPDDVLLLPGRREILAAWIEAGYQLFFVSNQSGIASGKLLRSAAEAAFLRTAELLRLPVTAVAFCPHPAFPVGCFCRKPGPGLGVYLMERYQLAREHLIVVGDMESDAAFAANLGATYHDADTFFSLRGPRPPIGMGHVE